MKKQSRHSTITIITCILCILLMVIIAGISFGFFVPVDQWLSNKFVAEEDGVIYKGFMFITELGSSTILLLETALFTCLIWVYEKKKSLLIWLWGSMLITFLLNVTIKLGFERERPSINPLIDAHGYSFPSGHAMVSVVAYGLFAFLLWRWFGGQKKLYVISFTIVVFLIGYSRVALSAHYILDVAAGFALGGLILIGSIQIFNRLVKVKETETGG